MPSSKRWRFYHFLAVDSRILTPTNLCLGKLSPGICYQEPVLEISVQLPVFDNSLNKSGSLEIEKDRFSIAFKATLKTAFGGRFPKNQVI